MQQKESLRSQLESSSFVGAIKEFKDCVKALIPKFDLPDLLLEVNQQLADS
ncbi:hypothetical protein NGC25_13700 [Enterococcus faecalis]|uniref:hypothetical protein n=1 Tax=Enterococcus faecalis TaxID=1351 RepID=UPI00138751E6|nr:hypothetical protein [Enterococcus faecalis]MEB7428324.1 hypothetical protein [Enterococcus faecalis]